jgi:hypothetical protein
MPPRVFGFALLFACGVMAIEYDYKPHPIDLDKDMRKTVSNEVEKCLIMPEDVLKRHFNAQMLFLREKVAEHDRNVKYGETEKHEIYHRNFDRFGRKQFREYVVRLRVAQTICLRNHPSLESHCTYKDIFSELDPWSDYFEREFTRYVHIQIETIGRQRREDL